MADAVPYSSDDVAMLNGHGVGDVGQKFILVVDVGTTTLRCHIYNKAARVVAVAQQTVRSNKGQ